MILIYLVTLLRHLKRHRNIALINILSYGLGIATCLILAQYINYELSYDKFYKDYEKIYRINLDSYYSGIYQSSSAHTYIPLGPELKERFPDVEYATTINDRPDAPVTVGDNTFLEKGIFLVDSNFFNVFHREMLMGSTNAVSANDVFISEQIATRYFGEANPIGSTMKVYSNFYTVKGVFKDLPFNTHFKFKILCIPPYEESNDWAVSYVYTYIKLNGDSESFNQKLKSFSEEFSRLADTQNEAEFSFQANLQSLAGIHLKSDLTDEMELNGKMENIYILLAIAIIVLVITCFNYVNMTNTINQDRMKEALIRKIHGASSRNAILQHCVESVVLNAFGFVAALLFLIIFVNWNDLFFNSSFVTFDLRNPEYYVNISIIFFVAFILSGVLPAILTSYRNRIQFLNRSSFATTIHSGFTRNIVFVQFMISFILISGAFIVLKQLKFMQEGELGFDNKGVIALEMNSLSYRNNESQFLKLKDDLEKMASVEQVSFSRTVPGEKLYGTSIRLSNEPLENTKTTNVENATSGFFKTYRMEIVAGRIFSEDRQGDENNILVNETLARKFNESEYKNILDKEVTVDYMRRPVNFTVIGIVKDYHHDSKQHEIQPMMFIPLKNSMGVFRISIKLNNHEQVDRKSMTALIQKTMKANLTEPYAVRGLDVGFNVIDVESTYNKQYSNEERFSEFLNALVFLAIVMAGIGFFSLAAATARRRTKEAAIRKVHGAQIIDVAMLLLGYFVKIVGIALIVSLPISYLLVNNWLNDFHVKTEIDFWFVLWPIIIAAGLIITSVSYHLFKLAFVNPVYHLRNE